MIRHYRVNILNRPFKKKKFSKILIVFLTFFVCVCSSNNSFSNSRTKKKYSNREEFSIDFEFGHLSRIEYFQILPNMKKVLTHGSRFDEVKLWDVDSGIIIRDLDNKVRDGMRSVISDDGRLSFQDYFNITNLRYENEVVDLENGTFLKELQYSKEFDPTKKCHELNSGCNIIASFFNGKFILISDRNNILYLLDWQNDKLVSKLVGHKHYVFDKAFYNDNGKEIFTSDENNIIKWDLLKRNITRYLHKKSSVSDFDISFENRLMVSVTKDCSINLWDINSGKLVGRHVGLSQQSHGDCDVEFSGNERISLINHSLVTSEIDVFERNRQVISWSIQDFWFSLSENNNSENSITFRTYGNEISHTISTYSSCSFSLKLRSIICIDESGYDLDVIGLSSGKVIKRFKNPYKNANKLNQYILLNRNNTILFEYKRNGNSRKINIWDLKKGELLNTFWDENLNSKRLKFSSDLRYMVSIKKRRGEHVEIWNLERGVIENKIHASNSSIRDVSFFPNNEKIMTLDSKGFIKVWNLSGNGLIKTINLRNIKIKSLSFLFNSKNIISLTDNNRHIVWDVENGNIIRNVSIENNESFKINTITNPFTKNHLFSLEMTRQDKKSIKNHKFMLKILDLETQKDTALSVSTSMDKKLKTKIYRIISNPHSTGQNSDKRFINVDISPNRQSVITTFDCNKINFWDIFSKKIKKSINLNNNCLTNLVFSNDGKSLIGTSQLGVINIWDSLSGKHLVKFVEIDGEWGAISSEGRIDKSNGFKYFKQTKDNSYGIENYKDHFEFGLLGKVLKLNYKTNTEIEIVPKETKDNDLYKLVENQNNLAIVIGNQNYKHLKDLRTPIKDVKVFGKMLEKKFGFHVVYLINSKRNDILDKIYDVQTKSTKKDNILIYYAGHGHFDATSGNSYWLPINAQRDNPKNWILSDRITDQIKKSKSNHILIISDSCYSGTFTRGIEVFRRKSDEKYNYLNQVVKRKSRTILSSGGNEPVWDSGTEGHSVFAYLLIKTFDNMKDNVFSMGDLFHDIKVNVGGNSLQIPEYENIKNSGHSGGDFIFFKSRR
jgi:WD40 repeat protein